MQKQKVYYVSFACFSPDSCNTVASSGPCCAIHRAIFCHICPTPMTCGICHEDLKSDFVQHPGRFGQDHRIDRTCFRTWYERSKKLNCPHCTVEKFSLKDLYSWEERVVIPLKKAVIDAVAAAAFNGVFNASVFLISPSVPMVVTAGVVATFVGQMLLISVLFSVGTLVLLEKGHVEIPFGAYAGSLVGIKWGATSFLSFCWKSMAASAICAASFSLYQK